MTQPKLLGIAIRSKSRAEMQELDRIDITVEAGCADDFRGKPGSRQVTVLSSEAWQATCADLGQPLPWTTRRANLLIEGIDLADSRGGVITIGDVELVIWGETDPCQRMNELAPGLCKALAPDWRGGVCCKVVKGGEVMIGASVNFSKAALSSGSGDTSE